MVLVDFSIKRMLLNVSRATHRTKQQFTIFSDSQADKKSVGFPRTASPTLLHCR